MNLFNNTVYFLLQILTHDDGNTVNGVENLILLMKNLYGSGITQRKFSNNLNHLSKISNSLTLNLKTFRLGVSCHC